MTKSSEYFKKCAESADNRFFGTGNKVKETNKTYTFKAPFEDFCFDAVQDFDKMVEIAKAQDQQNMKVANGFMGF